MIWLCNKQIKYIAYSLPSMYIFMYIIIMYIKILINSSF